MQYPSSDHFTHYILLFMSPRRIIFTSSLLSISLITYRGLPQRSSSSPTLFNLCVTCLFNTNPQTKILFFADYIVLYHFNRSSKKAANQLSRSLCNLNSTLNNTHLMFLSNNILLLYCQSCELRHLYQARSNPLHLEIQFT